MSIQVSSVKEYFETLPQRFVAAGAKGVNAVFQFELSGEGGGTYHVKVNDGTMEIVAGASEAPSATIKMNADEFIQMSNGKLSGVMAYMKGKMKVGGNVMLAQKMQAIFPPSK